MPISTTKSELKLSISDTYLKLKQDLVDIPVELTRIPELEGHAKGTKMSICDLLAYLVGWGDLVLKWYQNHKHGLPIDFPETGYNWNELGQLAQKFYKDHEEEEFETLLNTLDETVIKILRIVEKTDNETLYGKAWYKEYTLGRMIQLNTSSPYKNARTRVRKWKRIKELY